MDDTAERLHDVERVSRENAVAIERTAADAKVARDMALEARPLVLARSGDEQRRDKFELNVDQAHDKIRGHGHRIESLEKWKERIGWIVAGFIVAGQVFWWLLSKILGAK